MSGGSWCSIMWVCVQIVLHQSPEKHIAISSRLVKFEFDYCFETPIVHTMITLYLFVSYLELFWGGKIWKSENVNNIFKITVTPNFEYCCFVLLVSYNYISKSCELWVSDEKARVRPPMNNQWRKVRGSGPVFCVFLFCWHEGLIVKPRNT